MHERSFIAGEQTRDAAVERSPPAFWMACLLSFSIPWDDMVQLPGDIQLARVLAIAVALVWLASTLRGGSVRRPNISHGWTAAFLLWASVSVFWSGDPEHTVRRAFSYLQLFVISWTVYQFSTTRGHHLRLLQAFALGEFVLAGGMLLSFAQGRVWGDGRYTAPGVNPNDLAGTLALGVAIASYLIVAGQRRWFWLNAVYVPCATFCILLNASRTGLVALLAALIFPLLLTSLLSWKTRITAAVVIGLSVFGILNLSETVSWRRLATFSDQVAARDLNGRFDVWNLGMQLFDEHPVIGVGAGAFATATGGVQALAIAGHNSFLEVLVENGAVGLLLFSCILVAIVRSRYRAGRLETQLWAVLLCTWTLTNMANSWENKNVTWLMWGLALGYPIARPRPSRWLPQQRGAPPGVTVRSAP